MDIINRATMDEINNNLKDNMALIEMFAYQKGLYVALRVCNDLDDRNADSENYQYYEALDNVKIEILKEIELTGIKIKD